MNDIGSSRTLKWDWPGVVRRRLVQSLVLIAIVLMLLGFAAVSPNVIAPRNLLNILVQSSYLIIFALAQSVIILSRGFDLSLGSCVSTVSVVSALVMTSLVAAHWSAAPAIALGIAAGLAVGLAFGLFNGLCTSVLDIRPFIVTLGSLNIGLGISSLASGGHPVFHVPVEFSNVAYSGTLAGIPAPILVCAAVCLFLFILLNRTVFGRSLYLLGANPRAVLVAGIPGKRYAALSYICGSGLAALGALMLTARTGTGEPNLGGGLLLPSIAAAVIGGVSLSGGKGGVPQAILGAVFITVFSNGMNFMQVNGYLQQLILGAVVILGVFVDRVRQERT